MEGKYILIICARETTIEKGKKKYHHNRPAAMRYYVKIKSTVIKEPYQRIPTVIVYFSAPDYRKMIKYNNWANLEKCI